MTIDESAEKVAASWPPLTPAQNDLIRTLLSEPVDEVAQRRRSA